MSRMDGFCEPQFLRAKDVVQEIEEERINRKIKTAVSFSGGGASGSYEAGVMDALSTEGWVPDLLIGTSAGALNAFGHFVGMMGMREESVNQGSSSYALDVWKLVDRDEKGVERVLTPVWLWDANQNKKRIFKSIKFFFCFLGKAFLNLMGQDFCALFSVRPLIQTMASAVEMKGMPISSESSFFQQTGEYSAKKWYEREGSPEIIVTATDVTIKTETLFTLVRPETYAELVASGWMTVQILDDKSHRERYIEAVKKFSEEKDISPPYDFACFMESKDLLQAIVASASIPFAFPARKISFACGKKNIVTEHAFVDGGVVNNAPIHVAVDAGASHVISIELGSLRRISPKEKTVRTIPNVVMNVIESFWTAKELSTQNDIQGASRVNQEIQRNRKSDVQNQKRLIQIYRHAPASSDAWAVSFLDFNGKMDEKGRRIISLTEWAEYGRRRAVGDINSTWGEIAPDYPDPHKKIFDGEYLKDDGPFWRATIEPYPPSN